MYRFWCEVNEAWSEASLVWLGSFVRGCERGMRRDEVELDIWCRRGGWVDGYSQLVGQVVRGVIGCSIKIFDDVDNPLGIDLGGRCIPRESVGIAVSRIAHLNSMIGDSNFIEALRQIPMSYEDLYATKKRDTYIHCDIDGIFTEWFDLDLLLDEIEESSSKVLGECIVGVNEYEDIKEALAEAHSEKFIAGLDGVYINAGLVAFCNFRAIDEEKLIEFLNGRDSYCLEQDYINSRYEKSEISANWNYTYRKSKTGVKLLPYFIHFYGKSKPFLENDEKCTDKDIYEYWDEWYCGVMRVRGILSDEFIERCRRNFTYARNVIDGLQC